MVGKWKLFYKQGKSQKFLQYSPPTRVESIISGNRPEILFLKSHNKERLAMRDFIIREAAFISSRSPACHLWTVQSWPGGILFAQSKRLAGFPKRLIKKKNTQVFPVSSRAVKSSTGTHEHCRVRAAKIIATIQVTGRCTSEKWFSEQQANASANLQKTIICCLLMIKLR